MSLLNSINLGHLIDKKKIDPAKNPNFPLIQAGSREENMGKSEVQFIPIHHRPEPNSSMCHVQPATCKSSSLQQYLANGFPKNPAGPEEKNEEDNDEAEKPSEIPEGYEKFNHQMAGHLSGNNIGMLKRDGLVLKPIIKRECGDREINFYEQLGRTTDKTMTEMKNFVAKFYGTRRLSVEGETRDFIALEDLVEDFKEPCIMDIKIGRRTWDPDATLEKIRSEERKYQDCKRDLGFCIPGFQVYKLSNNQLVKQGKEFGKSLNKEGAEDAIKTFLNANECNDATAKPCRCLIVQFLAILWRILYWARNQRQYRFYSTSILLAYDARRLREKTKPTPSSSPSSTTSTPSPQSKSDYKFTRKGSLYRPMSLAVLNKNNEGNDRIPTGFSGQLTKEGPILNPQRSSTGAKQPIDVHPIVPSILSDNTWSKSMTSLKRTHSFQNNYDKDVQNRKQNYLHLLDELCDERKSSHWAVVKMIDFAHVFPAENSDVDENYLAGIESLVRVFEELLMESD
ncbi:unnamed protein product [Phyllotreta striolata]|uniref:Kinase n=1 Tax=Phyllotreta striolata TaxID=444603 RepID=A0A9N9TGK4_PHYSR|nr:unnamed protein product [Phyllotreta striolata]